MTIVAGGGVAINVGRNTKLTSPSPYRQSEIVPRTPAQPAVHCPRGDWVLNQLTRRVMEDRILGKTRGMNKEPTKSGPSGALCSCSENPVARVDFGERVATGVVMSLSVARAEERLDLVGESHQAKQVALLIGSEGTLAVIRRATVKLVPKPKNTILGVLAYDSIAAACDDTPNLLKHNPSAVELVPQMLIRLARAVPAYASQLGFVQGDPAALLVVEFSGDDKAVLREKAKALRADVLIAESAAEQAKVWNVRKVGLGIFDSHPAAARPCCRRPRAQTRRGRGPHAAGQATRRARHARPAMPPRHGCHGEGDGCCK